MISCTLFMIDRRVSWHLRSSSRVWLSCMCSCVSFRARSLLNGEGNEAEEKESLVTSSVRPSRSSSLEDHVHECWHCPCAIVARCHCQRSVAVVLRCREIYSFHLADLSSNVPSTSARRWWARERLRVPHGPVLVCHGWLYSGISIPVESIYLDRLWTRIDFLDLAWRTILFVSLPRDHV